MLGCLRGILVCTRIYFLFLVAQVNQHQEDKPPSSSTLFSRHRTRVWFDFKWWNWFFGRWSLWLVNVTRKNYSLKRRKERLNSFGTSSWFDVSWRRCHVKLKTRRESAHAEGRLSNRLRSSRQLQPRKVKNSGREAKIFNRRWLIRWWSNVSK